MSKPSSGALGSHDLHAPLWHIDGFAAVLEESVEAPLWEVPALDPWRLRLPYLARRRA